MYGNRKCYNTKWYIKGDPIKREDELNCLGVMLSNNSNSHISLRLKSGRGVFYKLQGVSLCANGLKPQAVENCVQSCYLAHSNLPMFIYLFHLFIYLFIYFLKTYLYRVDS